MPTEQRVFDLLTEQYGAAGASAARNLSGWISGKVPFAYPEILRAHLNEEHLDLLFDAFWQILPFGTGGRRGRVGYGSNRLNPTTVAMTVQGHCNYLKQTFPHRSDLTVVVANDVRVFKDFAKTYGFLGSSHPLLGLSSRGLGKLACGIYAGNGIKAYFAAPGDADAILTTPQLSFFISKLNAAAGMNLSASHNPPDDNGVKIFDAYGSQPIAPDDQKLIDIMADATDIRSLPFEQAIQQGLILDIPPDLEEEYVQTYTRLFDNIFSPVQHIPITYTPLCGCGGSTVARVLDRLHFPVLSPPDQGPDGTFSSIPLRAPNPEVPQSTDPARKFADEHRSTIVLSSDPDADRVGLEAKDQTGNWHHFDGNQIAAILGYFLMLDPAGPKRKGLVIETLVTTKILREIVQRAGDSWIVDNLLVGFKYVAEVLKSLQLTGQYEQISCSPGQLVLAAEESHGVIMAPSIRDKDATPACMYLAALHQRLQTEGKTLIDYYTRILEEMGGFDCVNRSITMNGAAGVAKRDQIMGSLRATPPKTLGGQTVNRIEDYWDEKARGNFVSESDKLPRNVIQAFTDSFIITVRPSGTEPKLKFYCQLLPHGQPSGTKGLRLLEEVRTKAEEVANAVYNDILNRIGVSLGAIALRLPDIIDLDSKIQFEATTLQALHRTMVQQKFPDLTSLLDWLREIVAPMAQGSDALPAVKRALALQCELWSASEPSLPLLNELRDWTS